MSSLVSWPTTRPISRDVSDFEIEDGPKFDQPEFFFRTPGDDGWYCSACAPSGEPHLHSFDATAAMNHELTQAHKDAVARGVSWEPVAMNSWGLHTGSWDDWGAAGNHWGEDDHWGLNVEKWGLDVDNWAASQEPFGQLRHSELSRQVPTKKRIMRWIRDIAKAEGIDFKTDEDLDEDDINDWTQWGAGGDDWKRPPEEWGFPVGGLPPPVDDEPDPRATADFKFVEKVAKKRGLTNDRRRLHAFYRLPTDEKISRIQEIVQFIQAH